MTASLPGITVVPVRTPTLPPATHTNTWVVGDGALTVIDPASPWEDEQSRLFGALRDRIDAGERVERLLLTHHHHDHVAGTADLQARLAALGFEVPIAAHPVTAALVADRFAVQVPVEHGDSLSCGGRTLVAHFTPGHAPGHLAFQDPDSGVVVAGDLVAGIGTIAIDPDEGDLQLYLDSLEHVRALSATALLPAHGPVLEHADAVLSFYVAHRHGRTDQIRTALDRLGQASPLELAPHVYPELEARLHPLAAAQILTHLKWLGGHGLAGAAADGRWALE